MFVLVTCLFLLAVFSFITDVGASHCTIVNTTYGVLHGTNMTSREGRVFSAFLGVPYAEPPTGRLRFTAPEPPEPWQGSRNATKEGNVCIQRELAGSEDCLYLNVFTHCKQERLLPVMVYIHGGGFYGGSASLDMYGPEYIMDKNVVLVTIQYRLGVFGFLSTEDSVVPGNMGLKDQVRALQWVQQEVKVFGGDPSRVTIFGNSAGAACVHLHMQSPLSKGLFKKAISQSGTAFSAFSLIGKGSSRNITNVLAKRLNCPTRTSYEILNCLQNKDSENIQQEYSKLQDDNYSIRKVLFRPVIEEPNVQSFISTNPFYAHTEIPWLVGVNKNEGLFKINVSSINETMKAIYNEYHSFLPAIMFFEDTCSKPKEVAEQIYNFYFKHIPKSETLLSMEQAISDSWFFWPTLQAMARHKGQMYSYVFEHVGEHSFTQVREGPQGAGVCHMDELHYLFSQRRVFPAPISAKDNNISQLLIDLWVNFAEQSDPTPNPISSSPQKNDAKPILWNPSNSANLNFFHIYTDKLTNKNNFFPERMHFWESLPARDLLYGN